MIRLLLTLIAALLASLPAFADMEKIATPCEKGFCFHWWPKLTTVKGWHHDRDQSLYYSFNAQVPDGETFSNADTVIYANAPFKPRVPELKTLQKLINNDQRQFRTDFPGVEIKEVAPLVTANGQKLRSFLYLPTGPGSWERVSYGEEGKFYLIFTVSSRTQQGLNHALSAYKLFINTYKSNP